jgi:hypothetical protein
MAISNHGRHGEPGSAKVVRCPYCVEGSGFRTMTSEGSTGGDWFICERCGHLSLLTNPPVRMYVRKMCAGSLLETVSVRGLKCTQDVFRWPKN